MGNGGLRKTPAAASSSLAEDNGGAASACNSSSASDKQTRFDLEHRLEDETRSLLQPYLKETSFNSKRVQSCSSSALPDHSIEQHSEQLIGEGPFPNSAAQSKSTNIKKSKSWKGVLKGNANSGSDGGCGSSYKNGGGIFFKEKKRSKYEERNRKYGDYLDSDDLSSSFYRHSQ